MEGLSSRSENLIASVMVSRILSLLQLPTVNVSYGNCDLQWIYCWPTNSYVLSSRNTFFKKTYRVWIVIETQLSSFWLTKWLIMKTFDRFCNWANILSNGFHIFGLQQNAKVHIGSKGPFIEKEVGGIYIYSLQFFYSTGKVMFSKKSNKKRWTAFVFTKCYICSFIACH